MAAKPVPRTLAYRVRGHHSDIVINRFDIFPKIGVEGDVFESLEAFQVELDV